MNTFFQDVRYSLRMLVRSPGFTAVAVLSLALGIGANTAIFSVISSVLIQPAPFENPERLVLVGTHVEREGREPRDNVYWSYPYYREFVDNTDVLEQSAAFAAQFVNMTGLEAAHRVRLEYVTGDYFSLLGIDARSGRTFAADEVETPGESPVGLLSDGIWRRLGRAGDGRPSGRLRAGSACLPVGPARGPAFRIDAPHTLP